MAAEPSKRKIGLEILTRTKETSCFACWDRKDTRHRCYGTTGCLFTLGAVLTAILVPLSLNSVEYNEYGLVKQRSTGEMHLDKGIYDPGRYALGPDFTFKKFRSDAHLEEFPELSVFSNDKLDSRLDIHVVYFLNRSELIKLHETFERSYRSVVKGRIIEAIKNRAPRFTTSQFFQNRTIIEQDLFEVVRDRVAEVFVDARSLYLARVKIPQDVREGQLKSAVQLEDNELEMNRQRAELIRIETQRQVNDINNNAEFVRASANAEAEIIVARAQAEAERLVAVSAADGLRFAYNQLNITTDEQKAAYDYTTALARNRHASLILSEDVTTIEAQQAF